MTWRLITEDGVEAARGLAGDEVLTRNVGGGLPPTLRLYTYRPHAALVGRFQDVDNEIHLDACERVGIEVNRRPTGGGAIIMGPDQLGIALAVRGRGEKLHGRPRDLMLRFSQGLIRGLHQLGIGAAFRGKNDLEVNGKKIAGLGIYRDPSGGLLFHASLLVDLDVSLMSRVLKEPFKHATESELATVATRTSTVRQLHGADVSTDHVRGCVAKGFAEAFSVRLVESDLDVDEIVAIDALAREKYMTAAWVHQQSDVGDTAGVARIETVSGPVEVHVALAGRMIKSLALRGDFCQNHSVLADLEARLRWHGSGPEALERTIRDWACDSGTLDPEFLVRAITDAVDRALGTGRPYACFANSERAHG